MKKIRKKLFFLPRQFYTLYEPKFSNLRPFLIITFPQGFRKFNKFGHWTLGSGGRKAVKQSKKHQYQKNPAQWGKMRPKANFFFAQQVYTLYGQQFSNLRPLFSITFPQGFRIFKKFERWTLKGGGKKIVKRSEQSVTDRQTHKTKTNKKWQNPS